jgi:hypothetical protein
MKLVSKTELVKVSGGLSKPEINLTEEQRNIIIGVSAGVAATAVITSAVLFGVNRHTQSNPGFVNLG